MYDKYYSKKLFIYTKNDSDLKINKVESISIACEFENQRRNFLLSKVYHALNLKFNFFNIEHITCFQKIKLENKNENMKHVYRIKNFEFISIFRSRGRKFQNVTHFINF